MHWFKILLVVVLAIATALSFVEAGRGNHQRAVKGRASFIGAILNGILLWGTLVYL